jgi:hypothetical protein
MTTELAEKLVRVPERFERTDCSTAALIAETGYLEQPDGLKTEDVQEVLASKPELAERWLARGQDQRLVGGWGIDCEGGRYLIRPYGVETSERRLVEKDRLRATAEFIVRYVGRIGEVMRRHRSRRMAVRAR